MQALNSPMSRSKILESDTESLAWDLPSNFPDFRAICGSNIS